MKPIIKRNLKKKKIMVQIGDKVKTGVYVLNEWKPMYIGGANGGIYV